MISSVAEPRRDKIRRNKTFLETVLDLQLVQVAGFSLIFLIAFFNLIDVEVVDKGDEYTLDWQVKCKLAFMLGVCAYGAYGYLTVSRVRELLLSSPGIWLTAICGIFLLTSLTSINKVNSIVSSGCIFGVVLGMTTFIVLEGKDVAVRVLYFATSFYVICAWTFYLAYPELGIFHEPIPGGKYLERMGGLSHPNTLGQFAAINVLLGTVVLRKYNWNRVLVLGVLAVGFMALMYSASRTSAAAGIVAVIVAHRDFFFQKNLFTWGLVAGIGVTIILSLGVVFANFEQKIEDRVGSLISKTENSSTDEITSATGRNIIWAKAWSLIQERKMVGWGAGTSKELLAQYTLYTHNLVLNVLLSTGYIGGLLIICLLLIMVGKLIVTPAIVPDGILVFILINGMMENVIFSNIPSTPTLIFVLAVLWRAIPERSEEAQVDLTG